MNKEVISDRQGISIIIIFLVGTSSLMSTGIDAKQYFWLAIILSILITLPLVLIYGHLNYIFPGKDLFDIIEICFGKFIGKIFIILFTLFLLDEGTEVLVNFGQFSTTSILPDTPQIIITISIIILCVWVTKQGIGVMGKWAEYQIFIFIILLFISILFSIPNMNINNIRPVLNIGMKPILTGILNTFTFPFGELIAFTMVFSNFKTPKSSYKIYILGLFIGGILVLVIALTNILVLGVDITSIFYHSTYITVQKISVVNFFQRIEIVISTVYLLGAFVKISIYLLATCKGISKIFVLNDYRFIVIPTGLLIIILSYLFFNSIMQFWEYTKKIWVYYALIFEIFLPLLIFIIAKFKKKNLKVDK